MSDLIGGSVEKKTVCISIGTTNKLKHDLDKESKRFLINKSRAAAMMLQHCLDHRILETLKVK